MTLAAPDDGAFVTGERVGNCELSMLRLWEWEESSWLEVKQTVLWIDPKNTENDFATREVADTHPMPDFAAVP